ncbi:MAG: hypothetical protein M5R42_13360 [Rhodocyclaceae bacterium]|nr:hypothetical protein [Rhodocyclaceae bacterium]
MTHIDLFIVSVLRALVEVALLALLGQGLLALLAGAAGGTTISSIACSWLSRSR